MYRYFPCISCYGFTRLALFGCIKLFIICIFFIILDISLLFFIFNSQCLASLEMNFSLVALSEI